MFLNFFLLLFLYFWSDFYLRIDLKNSCKTHQRQQGSSICFSFSQIGPKIKKSEQIIKNRKISDNLFCIRPSLILENLEVLTWNSNCLNPLRSFHPKSKHSQRRGVLNLLTSLWFLYYTLHQWRHHRICYFDCCGKAWQNALIFTKQCVVCQILTQSLWRF
jgi:hypothetical protein